MSTITPMPTAPTRTDPNTFSARADAWDAALVLLGPEINVVAGEVNANAVSAVAAAAAALASQTSASGSAAAAAASVATVGVAWVSGTTYAIGNIRYSPINFASYCRKTAGAGTIDPSLDSTNWAPSVIVAGTGGTTLTSSVTLTSTSAAAMVVTPVTPGLYATLPSATTLAKSTAIFNIFNAGECDYGIKDSTGAILGWLRPKTGVTIGLADNAAAAGVWVAENLQPTGITALYANQSATNTSNTAFSVTLDADRTMLFFTGTSLWAVIYNQTTQTWGTAVLVRASTLASFSAALLCATDKVLVCTSDNGTAMEAVTVSAAGTVATVNTANKATATLSATAYSTGGSTFIAVGSSFVFGYSLSGNVVGMRALTVATNTPTIGAESTLSAAHIYPPLLFAAGSVVRAISQTASTVYAQPYTVSGTSLTLGTATSFAIASYLPRIFQNGNGNLVALYQNGAAYATILKLTGTVEAASTLTLGFTLSANVWDYCEVSASKTFFIGWTGVGTWSASIATDTAGTISVGSVLTGVSQSTTNAVACSLVSSNSVTVAGNSTNNYSCWSFDCSSTAPTLTTYVNAPYTTGMMAYVAQKNYLNKRNFQTMLFAGRIIAVGSSTCYGDTEYAAKSLRRMTPGANPMSMNSGSIIVSNSDAYFTSPIDNGSSGMTISRLQGV